MKNKKTISRLVKQLKRFFIKHFNYVFSLSNCIIDFNSFIRIRIKQMADFLPAQSLVKGILLTTVLLSISNKSFAQTFLPPVTNPFGLTSPTVNPHPALIDLDNDGDLDLMLGNDSGNFLYYENTGSASSPSFIAPLTNPFGLGYIGGATSPTFADLDADGDFDMLSGGGVYSLIYFENTGTPSAPLFSTLAGNPPGLTSNPEPVPGPAFADLDGDGDTDILVGDYYGMPTYFENTGTPSSPSFGPAVPGAFGLTNLSYNCYGTFLDLDLDGDYDWLSGNFSNNFNYFMNVGTSASPVFNPNVINPFNLVPTPAGYVAFTSGDLNGDGSVDILGGAGFSPLYYYENSNCQLNPVASIDTTVSSGIALTTIQGVFNYSWVVCPSFAAAPGINDSIQYNVNVNGNYAVIVQSGICYDTSSCLTINTVDVKNTTNNLDFAVFPNPANGIISIISPIAGNYSLLNEVGQIIQSRYLELDGDFVMDVSGFPPGLYFIELKSKNGISRKKIILY